MGFGQIRKAGGGMSNVVTAAFGGLRTAKTRPLWQWDYGQILQFAGLALPSTYTVHFANEQYASTAKTMVGNADGVDIPDEYLITGLPVYAWVFLHTGADDGETVYMVTIPVNARPQPTEDEPTPVQQGAIDQAIAALNAGVERAETAAENAEDASTAAESAAQNIEAEVADIGDIKQIVANVEPLNRVASLDSTMLAKGTAIEASGIPVYVSNVADYPAYSLAETGWYVFARITAPGGVTVSSTATVNGAAGYVFDGDHVDVAVRFDVAAMSQIVTVNWGASTEVFAFKATDLAVRNLDYRTTFYVYDIAPYATWEYALTTDATFVADKQYYTKDGDEYTLAEVTAGETVPADTYYNHSKVTFSGMARNITYKCDTVIDCPQVYVLPEIEDDVHGCWYEIRLRHSGSFSSTLEVPEGVKVATEHTQAETAGLNMVDLHYSNVGGVKIWRFLNTHSSIPA